MAGGRIAGVLGGMGPAATLDFFARVLALSGAKTDQDHVHLLIDCNPHIPNRNEAVLGVGPSPAPMLAGMARRLEAAGADFLVMTCNTAHAFADAITGATRLPLVSIIDETAGAALRGVLRPRRVGLLASSGCLGAGLYQRRLAGDRVDVLVPTGPSEDAFMSLLYRIKSGDTGASVKAGMKALAQRLVDDGAQALIAGCTEVPLVLGQADLGVPFIDSTDCLARATIREARRHA